MILLDTCAIIWDALEPSRFPKTARLALKKASLSDHVAICPISFWEIAMLIKKGRLDTGTDFKTFIGLILKAAHYHILDLSPEIADMAVSLPESINSDPADRIIAATAIVHNIPLVTADNNLRKAKILKTVWE